MKSLINKILLSVLMISLVTCEDFFNLQRPQETQWTTTATFEQGLSSCYWNIQWSDAGRGWPQFIDFCTSGTASLMQNNTPGIDGHTYFQRKFDERLGKMTNVWSRCYRIVTMSNLATDLDKSGNGNPFNLDINGVDYKHNYLRQVAEYHFCRAWAYFTLIKTFAPPYIHNGANDQVTIPLKTSAAYSKEDVYNEKLGTKEEVYQQIISDLKYAKENLPEDFTLNAWNEVQGYECGRANKLTATTLLGKVYFLMGKYAEAKKEFDDIINSGRYSLEENPKDLYNQEKAWIYNTESIWEFNGGELTGTFEQHNNYMYAGMVMGLRFRDSNGDELQSSPTTSVGTVISTWNGFGVAYTALKEMGWMVDPMNGDYSITPEAEKDLRYQQVYHLMLPYEPGIVKGDAKYITHESLSGHSQVNTPHVYIDKFFRGAAPYGRNSKFPFLKISDIYLLRAWIKWKNNDNQGAADDLNIIWNRANPSNLNKFTSSNINHDQIYAEYLKEMTGEGWTVDFMMGTQMNIPAGDDPVNSEVVPPYSEWYWSIPDTEEALNPNY